MRFSRFKLAVVAPWHFVLAAGMALACSRHPLSSGNDASHSDASADNHVTPGDGSREHEDLAGDTAAGPSNDDASGTGADGDGFDGRVTNDGSYDDTAMVCENPMSCGTCGACVATPNATFFTTGWSCERSKCVASCYPGFGDCDQQPGCEAQLTTADNCGLCGRKACAVANTLQTCSGGRACTSPVCAPGFANCNASNPDCEAAFGTSPSCFPRFVDAVTHGTRSVFVVTAVGPDGSIFFGGDLDDTEDFDPTAGVDVRIPGPSGMAYLTKVNPDGSYAWTRTFEAAFFLFEGLAVDADSVVAVGEYTGAVDFDPGVGVATQTSSGNSPGGNFVLKLTQAGEYVWARSFAGTTTDDLFMDTVALSGGSLYLGGASSGDTDFDPGPGQSFLPPSTLTAFVLKLDANGNFVWLRGQQGAGCASGVIAMTATPQGQIWVSGSRQGSCSFGTGAPLGGGAAYVAALDGGGNLVRELGLASLATDARSISAAADGSIFVGGILSTPAGGELDLDPGPGVDVRAVAAGATGFVTKMSADGSYAWSQLMGGTWVTVSATPDGVLATSSTFDDPVSPSPTRFVSKLRADGTASWSLAFFPGRNDFSLAAGKTQFVVASTVDDGATIDFDPGPSVQAGPSGQTDFFSTFAY